MQNLECELEISFAQNFHPLFSFQRNWCRWHVANDNETYTFHALHIVRGSLSYLNVAFARNVFAQETSQLHNAHFSNDTEHVRSQKFVL